MQKECFPSIIIDSTSDVLSVILLKNASSYFVKKVKEKRHSSNIMASIDSILSDNNEIISNIRNIGVVVGPGSFTGIRIGVATANAIAKVNKVGIIELTSLESAVIEIDNILALIDCKNDNYYGYLKSNSTKNEYIAISAEDLQQYDFKRVYVTAIDEALVVKTFIKKWEANQIVEKAVPFYIKKSSAEKI